MPYYPPPASSGSGDVTGPASSVDNELAVFDSTTGKLLKGGTNITAAANTIANGGGSNLTLSASSELHLDSVDGVYIGATNAGTLISSAGFMTDNAIVRGDGGSRGIQTSSASIDDLGNLTATNFSGSSSGTNTGDQTTVSGNAGTATALQTARTIGALTGDVTSTGSSFDGTANNTNSTTVTGINGTSMATLATGILKNTTTTGVPSIAVAGDFPTLNQNTTGSAATLTTARTFRTNLASTSTASFNGSANVTPGVTGTLAVGNGGTGATTLTGILKGNGTAAVTAVTAPSGTIVGTTDTQTLTNKTIDASSNTVSNLSQSATTASCIFRARVASAFNIGTSQPTIIFDTEDYDIGSNYNNATGVFTAPVAGYYHFECNIYTEGTAVTRAFVTFISSGTGASSGSRGRIDGTYTTIKRTGGTWEGYLPAGGTMSLTGYATATSNIAATDTWLTGYLIAAA